MATIKDLAAKVGVSVATVSNVLNDKPNVGATVRRRSSAIGRIAPHRPCAKAARAQLAWFSPT
jgi:transcriptional regulator with XRE-family HTH domain